MKKLFWTKCTPGGITIITLPGGGSVALEYGENEVTDAVYFELERLGIIENKKPTTNKKKE